MIEILKMKNEHLEIIQYAIMTGKAIKGAPKKKYFILHTCIALFVWVNAANHVFSLCTTHMRVYRRPNKCYLCSLKEQMDADCVSSR